MISSTIQPAGDARELSAWERSVADPAYVELDALRASTKVWKHAVERLDDGAALEMSDFALYGDAAIAITGISFILPDNPTDTGFTIGNDLPVYVVEDRNYFLLSQSKCQRVSNPHVVAISL